MPPPPAPRRLPALRPSPASWAEAVVLSGDRPVRGAGGVAVRDAACHTRSRTELLHGVTLHSQTARDAFAQPAPLQTTAIAATTHRAFPGDGLQTPQRRALCPTQPYKPHSAVPFTQRDASGHSRMGRQKISHLTRGRESHSLCIAEPEGNGAGAAGNALITPLLTPSLNLYSQAPLWQAEKVWNL